MDKETRQPDTSKGRAAGQDVESTKRVRSHKLSFDYGDVSSPGPNPEDTIYIDRDETIARGNRLAIRYNRP